ncbi:MAG: hypothetical protein AAF772_01670, partial [Acidobacteriota bacterium]
MPVNVASSSSSPPRDASASGGRAAALVVLGLLLVTALPLVLGTRTLIARDLLHAHYRLAWSQTEALRDGTLLHVDPRRDHQPLLGNLNALPLYPDNLLRLVADPLWALNAHVWLHWLLAAWAMHHLARAWRLPRDAAWAAGAAYAASGYLLSLFNLYNLIAGAALTPLFAALCLRAGAARDAGTGAQRPAAGAGLVWLL